MPTGSWDRSGLLRRWIAIITSMALLVLGNLALAPTARADDPLPAPPPVLQRGSDHVTADNLPTVQINDGYVWAQTTIGTTVYAVGQFNNVRPAGAAKDTNLTPRQNVLAYNITNGNLITSFAPTVSGVVKAVAASPDGSRIYIGGSFNSVNGQTRYNFAALDASTGQLVSGFAPSVGGSGVYAIAATSGAVYVGGLFTQGNGTARKNLAAFAPGNGALLPWAPTTDLQVDAMVMEPQTGQVVAGGRFYSVNSQISRGLANLDPTSGALNTSWQAPQTVQNGWNSGADAGKAGIFALNTDSSGVYGTGWVFSSVTVGNLEGAFAADAGSGKIRWVSDCHGDHYGIYSSGSVVYTTSHTHQCDTVNLWPEQTERTYRYVESYTTAAKGTLTRSPSVGSIYKDWSGTPAPSAYNWFPDFLVGTTSGLGQAGLSITGTAGYVSIAGEFGSVNNGLVQGLTRFSTNPPGGAKQAPRVQTADWVPQAISVNPGTARVSIPANWDRDDLNLTYTLRRQGTSTPVATKTVASTWWNQPTVALTDTGLTPGTSYTYTITATDSDGNSRISSPTTVTATAGTTSAYGSAVLNDDPSLFYRLGGATVDWAGTNNPVYGSGVTTVTPGGVSEQGSSASAFNGGSQGIVSSTSTANAPAGLSQEAWFRTTSTQGGKILGYGDRQTGTSSNYDRHIYMANNGRVIFGVYPGSVQTITSPQSYNDGSWHHVVSTLGSDGMKLYIDGTLVASNPAVTSAQSYNGYWRIGGDNLSGWTSQPSSAFFNGAIDDVAIYPTTLSAAQISTHYNVGKGQTPPTASFTSSKTDLQASFDASASSAADGRQISSYSWDFGDNSAAGSGRTTTHSYSAPGTYQVTLTVTDDSGLTSRVTHPITVTAANQLPSANFTSTVNGMSVSVDGTSSTDPDGSITGYSWDWGDGTPKGTGMTASHSYTTEGSHTITLTVTDNDGGQATRTGTVTTTHSAPTASFTTVPNGLDVAVDASASSASDGATLSYSWNWGDGTAAGSGRTATHTYGSAGTYTVTLTVTDSLGKSATTTRQTTVSSTTYAASDDFGRTVASGWGAADVGGTWSAIHGSASAGSVDGSTGRITLTPGDTRNMALTGLSVQDSESSVQFALNTAPSQGNSYVGIASRQSSSSDYTVRVWMRSDGTVWLVTQQTNTVLDAVPVSGLSWAAGDVFNLRTRVTGTSPTTITARIWKNGSAEPSNWQVTSTDSTAALQRAGYSSLYFYRSGSASSSATASFDAYRVRSLSTPAPQPTAPTAGFTSSTDDLKVTVDAAGSTAAGTATISSYTWEWGDSTANSTGRTASHTYSRAGTFTVKLTVTDSNGLTDSTTRSVTVTAPAPNPDPEPEPDPGGVLASDDFSRAVTNGWGTADTGGAWTTLLGSSTAASVSDGTGKLTMPANNTRFQAVAGVPTRDVVLQTRITPLNDPASGPSYVGFFARQQANGDNYQMLAWLRPDGTVWLVNQRGATVLSTYAVPGLTWSSGQTLIMKAQVTGAGTTTIQVKIWRATETEPTNWQLTSTDTAAGLQGEGTVGVSARRSASATVAGDYAFDQFRAVVPD